MLPLAFNGIHVISPGLLGKITEEGVFSINKTYLRLAGQGERIRAWRADEYRWHDIGTLEKLEAARKDARERGLPA